MLTGQFSVTGMILESKKDAISAEKHEIESRKWNYGLELLIPKLERLVLQALACYFLMGCVATQNCICSDDYVFKLM